ncbi:MAG: LLM class flavin-dependent oxidoreductase [Acidimicrobiales bacterium]|nr:LLM class flavin-dependent oxidoreductase [Acidimicrobiales bacterium]
MKPLLLRYDLRAPAWLGSEPARLYGAALEQCEWADRIPEFTTAALSEHHGVDDGYCPSPVVLAGAVAARTSRIGILIAALILPLHDPVRMAEDLAVLDLIARGRAAVVVAAGYRPSEFAMFERPMRDRGRWLEEAIALLRSAWRGEPVARGDGTVRVTPLPFTPGGPPLLVGGSSPAAARRAARVGDAFIPSSPDPALASAYREERERLGLGEGYVARADGPSSVFVAEDPEAVWARIAPHALHETNSYAAWEVDHPGVPFYEAAADADELRARGRYLVVTPDECVRLYRESPDDRGLAFQPLLGGLDPEVGWSSLQLFADQVLPVLRKDAGGSG